MKKMYYLTCFSHDRKVQYFIYKQGRNGYNVTLFPAKATVFDTFEQARAAQQRFPMFKLMTIELCLYKSYVS